MTNYIHRHSTTEWTIEINGEFDPEEISERVADALRTMDVPESNEHRIVLEIRYSDYS